LLITLVRVWNELFDVTPHASELVSQIHRPAILLFALNRAADAVAQYPDSPLRNKLERVVIGVSRHIPRAVWMDILQPKPVPEDALATACTLQRHQQGVIFQIQRVGCIFCLDKLVVVD
jgi:hypothetical protein